MSRAFSDTKPHYEILDALRGVAALMVVWYHVCEGYSFAGGSPVIQGLNHGYLAVDFSSFSRALSSLMPMTTAGGKASRSRIFLKDGLSACILW